MGAKKNDVVIKEYVDYLGSRSKNGHITSVYEFLGDSSVGCAGTIEQGRMNLIGGEFIGIKPGTTNVALFRCPSYDVDDIISIKITGGALPFFSEVPCSTMNGHIGGTSKKRSARRRSVRRTRRS